MSKEEDERNREAWMIVGLIVFCAIGFIYGLFQISMRVAELME